MSNGVDRQCGLLMVAETVSLGVLSLPAAVAGLGLVPYVMAIRYIQVTRLTQS